MDAEALDLPNNAFDVVICSLGLMYFPNPGKALKEMYRVLKPGGRAVALVWGERRLCGWAEIFPIVDRRVESDVSPLFFQLGTGDKLSKSFDQAGFVNIRSKRFSNKLYFKDDEQAYVAAFLGGAVALAYQKFDENVREEVHKEYLESIQQFSNGKGYDIPGEFVITKGIKPEK
jgi:ubiquinone/menaquinone biosynthesis C-methylase UbiE